MKLRIPEHYTVANVHHPYTDAHVVKRGGYIQRVKIELPVTKGFTKKFGRRITYLDGVSSRYGSGAGTFHVSFAWGKDIAAKLLQDLVSYHWFEGTRQAVTFVVGKSPSDDKYDILVTSQGMSADAMIESAAEDVLALCADPDYILWSTEKEAQACIDAKLAEVEQADLTRAHEREVEADLIEAFNRAGFPTKSGNVLSFDVKTSKALTSLLQRLAQYLEKPADVF